MAAAIFFASRSISISATNARSTSLSTYLHLLAYYVTIKDKIIIICVQDVREKRAGWATDWLLLPIGAGRGRAVSESVLSCFFGGGAGTPPPPSAADGGWCCLARAKLSMSQTSPSSLSSSSSTPSESIAASVAVVAVAVAVEEGAAPAEAAAAAAAVGTGDLRGRLRKTSCLRLMGRSLMWMRLYSPQALQSTVVSSYRRQRGVDVVLQFLQTRFSVGTAYAAAGGVKPGDRKYSDSVVAENSLTGRFCLWCFLKYRPHALQRGSPLSVRRHVGVLVAPQLWHSNLAPVSGLTTCDTASMDRERCCSGWRGGGGGDCILGDCILGAGAGAGAGAEISGAENDGVAKGVGSCGGGVVVFASIAAANTSTDAAAAAKEEDWGGGEGRGESIAGVVVPATLPFCQMMHGEEDDIIGPLSIDPERGATSEAVARFDE